MQFISNSPWYYTLVCFILAGFLSGILYYRNKQNNLYTKKLLYVLTALRFISISIIAYLLLDVFVKRIINQTEKPLVIIAQDNSTSIVSAKDSEYVKTSYTKALNAFINTTKETYDVAYMTFDSYVGNSESLNFKGKETDISQLFSDIENNYANRNIGAVILATDGIYNKGTNPLYKLDKINSPIYCIALGDTTAIKDVWIQQVNHNQVAYLGNSFPVEITVNASDLKSKTLNLIISHKEKTVATEKILIENNSFSKSYHFMLDANTVGIQKYNVQISNIEDDKNTSNNAQSIAIDVIDNRDKILILGNAPHPDLAAIEQSISSAQTYEVEVALINEFNKPLKPYSLIILHQTSNIPPRIIAEMEANKQSTFFIGTFIPNGIDGNKTQKNIGSRLNDVEANIQTTFPLFNISNELKNYIKELPAVKCPFNQTPITNGADILLTQRIGVVNTDNPLLYFNETNGIKHGWFLGDGLWRWRLRDYADHENYNVFDELIHNTVQYLSVKADKSFFRLFTKKVINENESVDFTAEVYNQSYELITEPDVTLVIKNQNNKQYNYTFSKKESSYSLSAGQFEPGEYSYEAKVKVGEKTFTKSGVIVVKEIVSEKINTLANHQLLFQMASKSGGKVYYPNQFDLIQKEVLANNNLKSITYSHKELTDLIHLKWVCFLIIFLLGTEWFLRKYSGKI